MIEITDNIDDEFKLKFDININTDLSVLNCKIVIWKAANTSNWNNK